MICLKEGPHTVRSLFLSSPGLAPSSGLRLSAQRATELVGGRPTAVLDYPLMKRQSLSVVDRQRVPFLRAQERNQRRARGAPPLRPPRRLRLAFGQSRRRPATDERTGVQQPASRRAAGAMPLPESLRHRTGSSHREGTSAFAWRAAPTQKRPCLPECTFGTAPETLGQRHCARGAAAGGML